MLVDHSSSGSARYQQIFHFGQPQAMMFELAVAPAQSFAGIAPREAHLARLVVLQRASPLTISRSSTSTASISASRRITSDEALNACSFHTPIGGAGR
nr:hypothetical protein [Erwinia sp. Ejp617]